MFVDPGYVTGWAVFRDSILSQYGQIDSYRKAGDRVTYLREQYTERLRIEAPHVVFIEGVDMRGMHGNIHAIMRGDLTRLAYLVGSYAAAHSRSMLVTPLWKGNLSKTALRVQIKLMHPEMNTAAIPQHALDAVGMGVFLHAGRWPKKWRQS